MSRDKQFPPWQQHSVILHSQRLRRSFRHWTKRSLLDISGSPEEIAGALFEVPFVLVSRGTEPNRIFNYGNRMALELWKLTWEEFTQTYSRPIVPTDPLAANEEIFAALKNQGYINDDGEIRIYSATGKRFLVLDAIVWNLLDEKNQSCGQAATFSEWKPLK